MTQTIFSIEMLPAREGDCLVVTYGNHRRLRRIMVDGGRKRTYEAIKAHLETLPAQDRTFELLIVSHVDRDHIEGALAMLSDPTSPVGFRDVWFNGYHHLHDADLERFGPVQGERLTEILSGPGAKWNQRFGQHSVELSRAGEPITLPGGLQLTLLSPDRSGLEALIPEWDRESKRAGLVLGSTGSYERAPRDFEAMGPLDIAGLASTPFSADPSKPNRTSIAVLAEYAGRTVLLAADAHADRLAESLQPLAHRHPGKRLPLAAFKLPHHGSRYNLSPRLLALVDCRRYLVSSSGAQFHHPHREALARILAARRGVEFVFNYRSPETIVWDDAELRRQHRYVVSYPAAGQEGTIKVDLMSSPPSST